MKTFFFGFLVIYWWWNCFLRVVVENSHITFTGRRALGRREIKAQNPTSNTVKSLQTIKRVIIWYKDTNAGLSHCSPSMNIFLMRVDNWGITNSECERVNNNNNMAPIFQCQSDPSPDTCISSQKEACCSKMNQTHFICTVKSKSRQAWKMWMNDLIGIVVEAAT